MPPRVKTIFKSIFTEKESKLWYSNLIQELSWGEGVHSRKGFTRLACPILTGENKTIDSIVSKAANSLGIDLKTESIVGIYVNFYLDGEMFCPNHKHVGSKQMVISLGATRTLIIGKKKYPMKSGDGVIFGSSLHGVPKEPEVKEGRISIACFIIPNSPILKMSDKIPSSNNIMGLISYFSDLKVDSHFSRESK